jgi:glutamyl-tRNA synthetase
VYLRALPPAEFVALTRPLVEADLGRCLDGLEAQAFAAVAPLVQERAKRLTDAAPQVRFLFADTLDRDDVSWDKVMTKPEARVSLDAAIAGLARLGEWGAAAIEAELRKMLDEHGLSAARGLQPVRVAVTGSSVSPPLFESLAALGRERSLARLEAARARLGKL